MDSSKSTSEDLALIRQGLGVTEAFSSWPPALLEKLLNLARLGRHARGDLVHSEAVGEPEILTVVSGHLMVSRVNVDGSRASISILGRGLVIGIPRAMNPDDEALYDYRAHDNAVIVHFPAQLLFGMLDAEPFLWKSMARSCCGSTARCSPRCWTSSPATCVAGWRPPSAGLRRSMAWTTPR